MKKTLRIVLICVLLVGVIAALAACSENTKQDPIGTVPGINAKVSDNGGMAVQYGSYVYFVNGYAGQEVNNEFGSVTKGAIYRAVLKDGVPDVSTLKCIVPKNVYGSDTTYGGIYIVDGYLYYHTTSVEKNSNREYKTSEGVLMRTSLDGSKTDIIESFDDNSTVIYAGDNSNYLVYVHESYVYAVDASTKKIQLLSNSTRKNADDEGKQTALSYKFGGDYMVFTMYNYSTEVEANYAKDYIVWLFDLNTGKLTRLMDSSIYDETGVLFTTTIVDVVPTKTGFTLYYSKSGNVNSQKDGYYSQDFSKNDPKYVKANERRYTLDTSTVSYTNFSKLNNGYTLAYTGKTFNLYNDNEETANITLTATSVIGDNTASLTYVSVVEENNEVIFNYINSDTFTSLKLLNATDTGYEIVSDCNAIKYFSGKYDTSYVSYDIIGNVIYYLNDNIADNAYYFVIPALEKLDPSSEAYEEGTDISTGKVLGVITEQDKIDLIKTDEE